MAGTTQTRRDELRERLVDIAEARVREGGLAAVKARELAAEAGCAVGAIYNVFDDMTGLVLAVNLRTFLRMGDYVRGIIADMAGTPPHDRLVAIAKAYLHFAAENPRLWRSLFEVEMSAESTVPAWYLEELRRLFAIIAGPLAEIYPGLPPHDIDLRTRALFSSVHGIVMLGLERRISGVPLDRIEGMIEFLLRNVTSQTQKA